MAGAALVLALILVIVVVVSSSSTYTVRLLFSNASGLVNGDQVFIGPSAVGTVRSITLTDAGEAAVTVGLDSDAAPVHRGTVARIVENGLAGVASHYVTIQPASTSNPVIPSGGTISSSDTYAEVSLDQLFNSLNAKTRAGLANIIQGEGTSIRGKGLAANRTLQYLAPALASTARVTGELTRSEPAFDALLVDGAKTMQTLASRSQELTSLVQAADATTGAVASQSKSLEDALSLLPGTLSHTTTTLAGLRTTLNTLDPLVTASIPAVRNLKEFSDNLARFATTATPTIELLARLIADPSGQNLTTVLRETPALESVAQVAFPRIKQAINGSKSQIDYLRYYAPDIIAALSDLGQASANYDANGHYVRSAPFFGAYGNTGNGGELTQQSPADRYSGLKTKTNGRCPGSGTQAPAGDTSMPRQVSGCSTSSPLPGS